MHFTLNKNMTRSHVILSHPFLPYPLWPSLYPYPGESKAAREVEERQQGSGRTTHASAIKAGLQVHVSYHCHNPFYLLLAPFLQ